MTTELITTLANLALTLSLIVAVIFGIVQVRTAGRDRKERLTLETLRNFQSREFAELIHYVTRKKIPGTLEELNVLPDEERVLLIQFGQQMESLGMLVEEHFIDIDLVDKTLGSFVISSWHSFKKLYMDVRVKTKDPFLSEYFQLLAERLDKRMKENPREPFFKTSKSRDKIK
jgi:hypothetical protein